MTPEQFFTKHDKLIRGLIYKQCSHKDMCDDVYSEVVMSLLSAGAVFELDLPQQIAYIKRAVETTSYCQKKSLKKSRTYGDLQYDDDERDPEEYAIADDSYSPETEKQDFALRDKALELAEQYKATKKLITLLKKKVGINISNIHYSATAINQTTVARIQPQLSWFSSTTKKILQHANTEKRRKKCMTINLTA